MELKVQRLGGWKILIVGEERLDAYVSEDFKRFLEEAIADGTTQLMLDLSAVKFMDSSGLGAVVFCRQRLGNGGEIVLAGAQQEVATILKLTHLDQVFRLVDAPEQVLDAAE